MEENLTFEQLPKAVTKLTKEVSELKQLLLKKSGEHSPSSTEQFLTIQEAAEFMSLSVPTMYSKVSKGELPVMKRGKRLYFSRTELMQYLKTGHKKSNSEIETEVEAYLSNRKKA